MSMYNYKMTEYKKININDLNTGDIIFCHGYNGKN